MTEELIAKHLAEGIAPSEADVDQYAVDQNISAEEAHNKLMADPVYAVATHEHQLNKISNLLEEVCVRLISLEKKVAEMELEMTGVDNSNPLIEYPEVQMTQKL